MDTLVLLRDECAAFANALNRCATFDVDISIPELQRKARDLAGSLALFAGSELPTNPTLREALPGLVRLALELERRHAESCERKIAELMAELAELRQ